MNPVESAAAAFAIAGAVGSVELHPTGHINDAYLVATERERYLLQRLNPAVFADPDAVMANVVAVTDHLRAKGEPTLALVDTVNGASCWRDGNGAVWRMYRYIEDAHPLAVQTAADAALLGRTFGRFHRLLADLDPAHLRESLPGFHAPARRVAQLTSAVDADEHGRLGDARDLVDELLTLRTAIGVDEALAGLPSRVAHNDAKAANLLVDRCGTKAPTVVDLDTSSRRFTYRSQTDDGNPSYAEWSWHVTDAGGGCKVTVAYTLHPVTFWRRVLLAKIRTRQLHRELASSLEGLAAHVSGAAHR